MLSERSDPTTLLGIRGHLIDAPGRGRLRARREGALLIEDGRILDAGDYLELGTRHHDKPIRWLSLDPSRRHVAVFPGLIDLHAHLPQYPAVARGEAGLLPWLERHIFPLERGFTGERARRESAQFFRELARHGTTTAMLYAAIFEESCEAAFEAAQASGMRVIMGKVMMDIVSYGSLPAETVAAASLAESQRLCRKWHGASDGLLEYAFSPRFAVSCSRELMTGAAALAKEHGARLQTHLSESRAEIERVKEMHPWARDYADVYEKCGLLTDRTVLAHCVHLSRRERKVLAAAGAAVAHCPTSNLFLGSGIMPLDAMQDAGLRIGLGSDVAAGPELNLWQVMRSALESQKARSSFEKAVRVPSAAEILHLATQGAAEALGKGERIGSLDAGKEADLTLVDYGSLLPYPENTRHHSNGNLAGTHGPTGRAVVAAAPAAAGSAAAEDLSAEDILSLCIHRGGPRATVETFVRGRSIYRADVPE